MNVPAPTSAAVPAVPSSSPYEDIAGLEDFAHDDIVMPTIHIDHKKAVYVDGLSKEEWPSITVVLLGLIKQRVLWTADDVDDAPPLCKSYDHEQGIVDPKGPTNFPWAASGFSMRDYMQDDGSVTPLNCSDCSLKEWGTNPKGNTPWCTEQYTFALLLDNGQGEFNAPAVVTFQRTGVKPVRSYLSSFARSRQPLFTVETTLSLVAQRKGTVDFAVPTLARGAATDDSHHPEWAETFRRIRETMRTPRVIEDTPVSDPTPTAPATTAAPAASALSDDEMPF